MLDGKTVKLEHWCYLDETGTPDYDPGSTPYFAFWKRRVRSVSMVRRHGHASRARLSHRRMERVPCVA